MGCALAHTRQSALGSGKGCGAAAVQTLKLGASSKGAAEDEGPCVGQPGHEKAYKTDAKSELHVEVFVEIS